MPTNRPRHFVTETDDLSRALDAAARRWPELSRAQLIAALALEGHHALVAAVEERQQALVAAVHRHAGAATGSYGEGYLEQLRAEWPS